MTDSEIIKALECCSTGETYDDCEKNGCPLYLGITMGCKYIDKENQLYSDALDLINRQQAEIEQWKEEANKYQKLWCIAMDDIEIAQSGAIQEFAERLKERQQTFIGDEYTYKFIYLIEIDNLVKEYEKGR